MPVTGQHTPGLKTAIMDIPYNSSKLQILVKLYFLPVYMPFCQLCDGGQDHVRKGFKAVWLGELSDKNAAAVYVYYKNGIRHCRY